MSSSWAVSWPAYVSHSGCSSGTGRCIAALYVQAVKDPELLAEARRAKMDIDPVTGEELQTLIQEVMNQPAEVIERTKKFLAN